MDVVVHQAIRVAPPAESRHRGGEQSKEPPAVVVVEEDVLPAVPA
jgi:hypothetical protein